MRILGEAFPLLVQVGPMQFTEESVREMAALYEPYFARGEPYATLTLQPRNAKTPGAKERKLIVDWVTSPRVAEATKRLCVASATVLPNPIARGVLTAMLWVWSPPVPIRPVATVEEGLDHCFGSIARAGLKLPKPVPLIRQEILQALRSLI